MTKKQLVKEYLAANPLRLIWALCSQHFRRQKTDEDTEELAQRLPVESVEFFDE